VCSGCGCVGESSGCVRGNTREKEKRRVFDLGYCGTRRITLQCNYFSAFLYTYGWVSECGNGDGVGV
jgi:hypothetical protein